MWIGPDFSLVLPCNRMRQPALDVNGAEKATEWIQKVFFYHIGPREEVGGASLTFHILCNSYLSYLLQPMKLDNETQLRIFWRARGAHNPIFSFLPNQKPGPNVLDSVGNSHAFFGLIEEIKGNQFWYSKLASGSMKDWVSQHVFLIPLLGRKRLLILITEMSSSLFLSLSLLASPLFLWNCPEC